MKKSNLLFGTKITLAAAMSMFPTDPDHPDLKAHTWLPRSIQYVMKNHQSKNTENDNKWLQQFEETVFEHYRVIHSLTTLGTNPGPPPPAMIRFLQFLSVVNSIIESN